MKYKKIIYQNNLLKNFNLLNNFTKDNDGATYDAKGNQKNYKTGYQVSILDKYAINNNDKNAIKKAIKKAYKTNKNSYDVGLWLFENILYIDYTINIQDKQQAILTAKRLKQKSVYDWQKKDCLIIGGNK